MAAGCAVILGGIGLAKSGDAIADATGLGKVWVGSVMLAAATSLPEIATDVAAVRMGAFDLAAGDLFGSSMANMLILGVTALLPFGRQLLRGAALDHALAGSYAVVLNALATVCIVAPTSLLILGVSPQSLLLLAVWLLGTRAVYQQSHAVAGTEPPAGGARGPAIRFGLAAILVLVAAPAFAWSAKEIAVLSGLGETLVGTWLVGLSTSLPELTVCIAAVRMGQYDLAVGNLFGSNAMNMAIFFAMDVAAPGRSIFTSLSQGHVLTGLLATMLTGLGLAALVYRVERRSARLEPYALLVVVAYVFSLWLVFKQEMAGM